MNNSIIYLTCSIERFSEASHHDYNEDHILDIAIIPQKEGKKCYVCGELFKNNDKAVCVILPKREFSFNHVLCHNDCYLLMTMDSKGRPS